MIPNDTLWFWWPATFAVITAIAATHIAQIARRDSTIPGRPLALGTIAVLSVIIPVVPLTIGLGAACSDTGLEPNINIYGIMVGILALVGWAAVLWRLYVQAGGDRSYVERYPVIILFATVVGMVLEFVFSMHSMAEYCDGSWAAARIHLLVAGICAIGAGCVVSALMRIKYPTRR